MGSWECRKLIFSFFVLEVGYAISQDYYEQRHTQHVQTQGMMGNLKEIPKSFELFGENSQKEFPKYIHDIQNLAHGEDMSVVYKVKVKTVKPKSVYAKKYLKKSKPKKYNVPLKKSNMKLSNFEILIRKLADTSEPNKKVFPVATTEDQAKIKIVVTTKIPILKYKPILNKARTRYSKVIKPIREKVITLTPLKN